MPGLTFDAEPRQRFVVNVGALRAGELFATVLIEAHPRPGEGPSPRALLRAAIDVTIDGSGDVRPIAPPRESVQLGPAVVEVKELFGVAASAAGGGGEAEDASAAAAAAECTVCMSAPCDTALLPCAHVCVCAACGDVLRLRRDPCPICRAPVGGFMLLTRGAAGK